jgi:hypothetical protein
VISEIQRVITHLILRDHDSRLDHGTPRGRGVSVLGRTAERISACQA